MNFPKILKQVMLTGTISCCSFLTFAQGFYAKVGGGYNFGIASASGANYEGNIIQDQQTGAIIGGQETARLVKINYGKGIAGSAAIGYRFNKNLGAELEISYLHGGKNKTNSTYIVKNESVSVNKFDAWAKMIYFQPSLFFQLS